VNPAQKKKLKSQAHSLKPVITLGQHGLTEAVLNETDLTLNAHELIKVKIRAEKEERQQICEQLCQKLNAEPIQHIGQIVIIYRKNPDK